MANESSDKGRRVTVDLTAAAAAEVDRLRTITELSVAEIFRHALTIFRIYVNAKQRGEQLHIVAEDGAGLATRIELPFVVLHEQERRKNHERSTK